MRLFDILMAAAFGGGGSAAPAETFHIEMEASTDDLLMETGEYLLLESAP